MTWCDQISQIESDLAEHRVLISSALLNTASAVRGVAADSVLMWLNREITGYQTEDLNTIMNNNLQASLLAPRSVSGSWGIKLENGIFIEKGDKNIVVGCSIFEIEETMDKLFDISVFEKGDLAGLRAAVERSASNVASIYIRSQQEGITYAFSGNSLIEMYVRIGCLLSDVIAALKHFYTGKELLRLNFSPEQHFQLNPQMLNTTQISNR